MMPVFGTERLGLGLALGLAAGVLGGGRLGVRRGEPQPAALHALAQQRLELDQLQRQRALERTAPSFGDDETRRRLYLQQDAFRTERQLQSQRFYLEQQRFMQSTTPPPLQPLPAPGALRAR